VSVTAPPAGISPTVRLFSTHWRCGATKLGARAALGGSQPSLDARVTALARAYADVVTGSGELLALMFAGKHADPDGSVHRASEAALEPWQEVFREAGATDGIGGPVEVLGMAVFSAVHGLVVLVNAGVTPADGLHSAVADMTERILRGSRITV
jgi:hypothetical protein